MTQDQHWKKTKQQNIQWEPSTVSLNQETTVNPLNEMQFEVDILVRKRMSVCEPGLELFRVMDFCNGMLHIWHWEHCAL
jgi:hypothetical protein